VSGGRRRHEFRSLKTIAGDFNTDAGRVIGVLDSRSAAATVGIATTIDQFWGPGIEYLSFTIIFSSLL